MWRVCILNGPFHFFPIDFFVVPSLLALQHLWGRYVQSLPNRPVAGTQISRLPRVPRKRQAPTSREVSIWCLPSIVSNPMNRRQYSPSAIYLSNVVIKPCIL